MTVHALLALALAWAVLGTLADLLAPRVLVFGDSWHLMFGSATLRGWWPGRLNTALHLSGPLHWLGTAGVAVALGATGWRAIRTSDVAIIRWRRSAGVAMVAGLALLAMGVPALARRSLLRGGPFVRDGSAWILLRMGRLDMADVRSAIEAARWGAEQADLEEMVHGDWIRYALGLLGTRQPSETAQWLTQVARERPSPSFVVHAYPYLIALNVQETYPLLLRVACFRRQGALAWHLVDAGLPEAIIAAVRAHRTTEPLDDAERQRLAKLLGRDAGPWPQDWIDAYDLLRADLPTPLPADLASESRRVLDLFSEAEAADRRLSRVIGYVMVQELVDAGDFETLGGLFRIDRAFGMEPPSDPTQTQAEVRRRLESEFPGDQAHEVVELFRRLDRLSSPHRVRLTPPSPDPYLPSLEAFEGDVRRYVEAIHDLPLPDPEEEERLNRLIEERFGDADAPSV